MTRQHSCQKFTTQMDSALLAELRALAKVEGRQLQSLIEEAVSKMIVERQTSKSIPSVTNALAMSLDQFGLLNKTLAE